MSHKFTISQAFFLLVLLFGTTALWAQNKPSESTLPLQNRVVDLNTDLSSFQKTMALESHNQPEVQVIFQFKQGESSRANTPLFTKEYYLGEDAFLCTVPKNNINRIQFNQTGIKGWATILPSDKISPAITLDSTNSNNTLKLLVQLTKSYNKAILSSDLNRLSAQRDERQPWLKQHILIVEIATSQIRNLASSPFVLYIQPAFKPHPLNVFAEGYTNAEMAHEPVSLGGYDLLGNGVTLGIGDNSNPNHIDYIDRLKSFSPAGAAAHGMHTTGTVGGNGIKDQRFRGFAPECNLIADFFTQILANAPAYTSDFDMVATNNSYAMIVGDCNYAGTYDIYSNSLDQMAFDFPHLLNVFAAGNDGALHCSPYPNGYKTVVGAYATAKNVLTVGAIGRTRDIEYYKFSRGPVKDGRLKPEITAMGYRLFSTWTDNGYHKDSGTSMSTPNVTGSSGLIVEKYRQLHANTDPNNALVKLLLMNGADDISTPGPDYRYGFGLLNVGRSLKMLDGNQYFSDSLQTNQIQNFSFTVPANTAVAKIMVYWNDPAASPMATKELVNDLDLTVSHNATTYLPLVLNPTPSLVTNPAAPGMDHLNNVEQVTLNAPTAGSYTIHVKGYDVPEGPQKYYVAYSFIPDGIQFQYPFGGEAIDGNDSIYVYWQASDDSNPFSLYLSTDSGVTWQSLATNIPSDKRAYVWYIDSTIHSGKCMLKLTRGSEVATDKPFTVTQRPVATLSPAANQCPGSIRFSWHPINGITQYRIFRKYGIGMDSVGQTTDTTFTITGLSPDSVYWVAVSPVVDGKVGMRSIAFSYQPNQGNCTNINSHGDLRLSAIVSPKTGRNLTSSALTSTNPFQIQVANLDNQVANNYTISWQLNNGSWQSQTFTQNIAAANKAILTLPTLNLADTGDYLLKVAVNNNSISDPVTSNDTMITTVRQLANPQLDLDQPFEDGFEGLQVVSEVGDTVMGVGHSRHWDFAATKSHGRLRSYLNSGITITGNRSISMDNTIDESDTANCSQNYFTGTFNLSLFNAQNDEIRCDFNYFLSGMPKFDTGNEVWVRGNETDSWVELFHYQTDTTGNGTIYNSGTLSLTDALTAAGQNFSSSTQIRFGQRDTSQISASNYGNGLTIDNFRVYVIHNDIQMLAIDSIAHYGCGLSNHVPLKIKLCNSVQNTIYNIPVSYQLDNNPIVTETIDSIQGKDTIIYQFQQDIDLSAAGTHYLSAWSSVPTDSYKTNDSIIDYVVRNQPLISTFPYLQDFESGDGYFYSAGINDSWQFGTPASPAMDHAASGQNAWKTNLTGRYNDNELSYLYSPCFDISSLQNPMLSFSLATDIENNPDTNTVYDEGYVEYSTDGINWHRLTDSLGGYNWYNNTHAKAWTKEGETWWHVATVALPNVSGIISFRFVMKSDPGATFEGMAVDDIHIYNMTHPIFSGDSLTSLTPHNIAANTTDTFFSGNEILAAIHNPGATLNQVTVQRYHHVYLINADSSQYYLPESFVVKSNNQPGDSVDISLFVLGDAMKQLRNETSCPSCAAPDEMYQMGISKYSDNDPNKENDTLSDDQNGTWNYIPWQYIRYIPYGNGYKVEAKVGHFSEMWFNGGGPSGGTPLSNRLFDFQASHYGKRLVKLTWSSSVDDQISTYFIQSSLTGQAGSFHTISQLPAIHETGHVYTYIDLPELLQSFVLYRIVYETENGEKFQSIVRRVDWTGNDATVWINPNPVNNGTLNLNWMKGETDPVKWRLFDNTGRLIQSGEAGKNSYSGHKTISMSKWGLSAGIYILKVSGKSRNWHFKVVYEK